MGWLGESRIGAQVAEHKNNEADADQADGGISLRHERAGLDTDSRGALLEQLGTGTWNLSLMNGLERGPEQQRRFFVACGPAAFAVDALPGHFELLVDEHHRLRAAAAGATDAMPVEHVVSRQSSLHEQFVGSYKPLR